MVSPRLSLVVIAVLLAARPLPGQQQDAPAVDPNTILRDLDQLEEKQKQAIQSARSTALSQLKAAAASGTAAVGFYVNAVEAMQFDGVKGQGAAFSNWKSSKADIFRAKELQTVLLLHLKYLVLSLERKGFDKPELFVPPSLAYVNELIGVDKMFLDQDKFIKESNDKAAVAVQKEIVKIKDDLLGKSLQESIFVKWFRLELPKGEDWELVPGNIPGILEKNIRMVLRKAKDPRIIETWELEMKVLADRVTFGRLEQQASQFNTVTRPRLQFSRANDMVEVGQKNRAINEIYGMVKTYPQHPDFDKWVQRLRELLKPAVQPAPSAAPDTSPQ